MDFQFFEIQFFEKTMKKPFFGFPIFWPYRIPFCLVFGLAMLERGLPHSTIGRTKIGGAWTKGPGPMGPKGGPMGPKKGAQKKGPYSLMVHQ